MELHISNDFINLIKHLNLYSTSETIIGYDTDGNPIYRKIVSATGTQGNSTNRKIAHGISNFKTLIKCEAVATNNNGTSYPSGGKTYTLEINKIDSTDIYTNVSGAFDGWVLNYILEYKKTS